MEPRGVLVGNMHPTLGDGSQASARTMQRRLKPSWRRLKLSRQWRSLGREKMRGSCTENIICALGCGLSTGPQVRDSKHALCQAADGPRSATGSNFAAGVQVSPQDFQTQGVIINSRNGYNFFTSILPYCERKVLC